ncbi:hypothetical protein D3C71_1508890 [compost metagenome]
MFAISTAALPAVVQAQRGVLRHRHFRAQLGNGSVTRDRRTRHRERLAAVKCHRGLRQHIAKGMAPAQRGLQAAFGAIQREVRLRAHAQRAAGLLVAAALAVQGRRAAGFREAAAAQVAPGQAHEGF